MLLAWIKRGDDHSKTTRAESAGRGGDGHDGWATYLSPSPSAHVVASSASGSGPVPSLENAANRGSATAKMAAAAAERSNAATEMRFMATLRPGPWGQACPPLEQLPMLQAREGPPQVHPSRTKVICIFT